MLTTCAVKPCHGPNRCEKSLSAAEPRFWILELPSCGTSERQHQSATFKETLENGVGAELQCTVTVVFVHHV